MTGIREELQVVRTIDDVRSRVAEARAAGSLVGAVPTLGALHAGHAALMDAARERTGYRVATIFLNPYQFAEGEDFDKYPAVAEADAEVCRAHGIDLVFAPPASVMYPRGQPQVQVQPGPGGSVLEGAVRPHLFPAILTVVAKLLHIVGPDLAFFGEKDAQQLALIRRMVRELDFPVEIVGVPTVRDHDGMALSSRNAYLSAAERGTAVMISRALRTGAARAAEGAGPVLEAARAVLGEAAGRRPPLNVDYVELIDAEELLPVPLDHAGPALLTVSAAVGTTHLIDNHPLLLGAVTEGQL